MFDGSSGFHLKIKAGTSTMIMILLLDSLIKFLIILIFRDLKRPNTDDPILIYKSELNHKPFKIQDSN